MLTSKQRSFLSGLANGLEPVVMIGKQGLSPGVRSALETELGTRELVKLRFIDLKDEKREIAEELAKASRADLVRIIGNVAIFYRPSSDPGHHRIELPA